MKIDSEKVKKYIERIAPQTCPLCGKDAWTVSPFVYQLLQFEYTGLTVGGPVYPVVAISCDNCGNTYFVNAIRAGIIDPASGKEAQQ